jgi:hypothetical protein
MYSPLMHGQATFQTDQFLWFSEGLWEAVVHRENQFHYFGLIKSEIMVLSKIQFLNLGSNTQPRETTLAKCCFTWFCV